LQREFRYYKISFKVFIVFGKKDINIINYNNIKEINNEISSTAFRSCCFYDGKQRCWYGYYGFVRNFQIKVRGELKTLACEQIKMGDLSMQSVLLLPEYCNAKNKDGIGYQVIVRERDISEIVLT